MRTTTVVWSNGNVIEHNFFVNSEEKQQRLSDKANEIAGANFSSPVDIQLDADRIVLSITRAWPDLAAAEAWVNYIQTQEQQDLVSAQVNPE